MTRSRAALLACLSLAVVHAQVYAPYVMRRGQVDTRTLAALSAGICERAGARTPREKAEAIWRFFLTDGRFVKPGFWYHIAGWAYEEPAGEVLDPLKLLNSYGFGLCYQVAPLLAAVWDAAGFEDARVWFLTGHTVAEVFYDGGYHYFDSDVMGYNTAGDGPPRQSRVASVRDLEREPGILLGKLLSPTRANPALVDDPWYPADVRAGAMDDLAGLFRSTADNRLFPFTRYPRGHTMDFVLRPGERMIRFFRPEEPRLFYLPYSWNGAAWQEFPHEIAEYQIRTADGPRSQKDHRLWTTGRLEYEPELQFDSRGGAIIPVQSPYVIIDAAFALDAALPATGDGLDIATSSDGGDTWQDAATLRGPYKGPWRGEPKVVIRSEHGRLTAVSGHYDYLLRIACTGAAAVRHAAITTRFQLNPRTLPDLAPGRNELLYSAGTPLRRTAAAALPAARNARWLSEAGQGFWVPSGEGPADLTFEVASPDAAALSGFDAGGRFLDVRDGLAPDKLTAEVRHTTTRVPEAAPAAAIEWSLAREGPYRVLWSYRPEPRWRDGEPIARLLRWPEVDERVRSLPAATRRVYVRYRFAGMALDSVRLAVLAPEPNPASKLEITHVWREAGRERRHLQVIGQPGRAAAYTIEAGADVTNEAVIFYCPR